MKELRVRFGRYGFGFFGPRIAFRATGARWGRATPFFYHFSVHLSSVLAILGFLAFSELFCLQLRIFAYSPLRPLLDALSHCKQKAPNVSKKRAPDTFKFLRHVMRAIWSV